MFSVLFADDTTCLAKGFNLRLLTLYVNEELRKIANWFRSNKMALNTGKTKFMIFRTRGKPKTKLTAILFITLQKLGMKLILHLYSPLREYTTMVPRNLSNY